MGTRIVAVIPSRGVVHSRTMESVYRELCDSTADFEILFEHEKPIPEAQNSLIGRALHFNPDWILMVEEDIVIPAGGLKAMHDHAEHALVIAAKYRLPGGTWSYKLDASGNLLFAGTGCLLLWRELIESIQPPWFRTDKSWSFTERQGFTGSYRETFEYGGHDVDFFANLKQLNVPVALAEVECKHLRVVEWGAPNTNNGCHVIREVA